MHIYRKIASTVILVSVITLSQAQAARIEKGTVELGGLFAGYYQFSDTSQTFLTAVTPLLSYYFSEHWFIEGGIGLQYASYAFSAFPTNRTLSILPTAGIGFYTRLSNSIVFAIPIFFNTSYYFDYNNGQASNDFGASVNYGLRPTLKFQIAESVNLALFWNMQSMLVNLHGYLVPSVWTYGIAWTYCW